MSDGPHSWWLPRAPASGGWTGPPVAHSSASARPGAPAVTPTLPPAYSPEQLVGWVPGCRPCSGQGCLSAPKLHSSWPPPCSVPPCSVQLPHPRWASPNDAVPTLPIPGSACGAPRLSGLRQTLRELWGALCPHTQPQHLAAFCPSGCIFPLVFKVMRYFIIYLIHYAISSWVSVHLLPLTSRGSLNVNTVLLSRLPKLTVVPQGLMVPRPGL